MTTSRGAWRRAPLHARQRNRVAREAATALFVNGTAKINTLGTEVEEGEIFGAFLSLCVSAANDPAFAGSR